MLFQVKRAAQGQRKAKKRHPMQQLLLRKTGGWGGRRKHAGRKKKPGAGINHVRRPRFRNLPVHVTLRLRQHVWNLRSRRCYTALTRAFAAGRARFGLRLCHYSVQGNHLHFVIEADDTKALSRGMQGLAVRMARALNRVMGRRGSVFASRFHAHVLRTPREVRHALAYVLGNHAVHAARAGRSASRTTDVYSSVGYIAVSLPLDTEPIVPAQTWLLRRALARNN